MGENLTRRAFIAAAAADLMVDKQANVYLPADYDPSRPYDVLYLLHGTGGMQDYWLGEPVTSMGDYHGVATANLLDLMPKRFKDGQNYAWVCFPGGEHDHSCWALDLYNTLLCFFR